MKSAPSSAQPWLEGEGPCASGGRLPTPSCGTFRCERQRAKQPRHVSNFPFCPTHLAILACSYPRAHFSHVSRSSLEITCVAGARSSPSPTANDQLTKIKSFTPLCRENGREEEVHLNGDERRVIFRRGRRCEFSITRSL